METWLVFKFLAEFQVGSNLNYVTLHHHHHHHHEQFSRCSESVQVGAALLQVLHWHREHLKVKWARPASSCVTLYPYQCYSQITENHMEQTSNDKLLLLTAITNTAIVQFWQWCIRVPVWMCKWSLNNTEEYRPDFCCEDGIEELTWNHQACKYDSSLAKT